MEQVMKSKCTGHEQRLQTETEGRGHELEVCETDYELNSNRL
jgi:hypothetical protein